MEDKSKIQIVILSRNTMIALSTIRALGGAGFTVDLISSVFKEGDAAVVAASKFLRHHKEIASTKHRDGSDEDLLNAIRDSYDPAFDNHILLPVDDYTAAITDLNRASIERLFKVAGTTKDSKQSLLELMDESFQRELARKAGFFVPDTRTIQLNDEIYIDDSITYPCCCRASNSFFGYINDQEICYSKDELRRHLNRMKNRFSERSALVEEKLTADDKFVVMGLCNGGDIYLPDLACRREENDEEGRNTSFALTTMPLSSLGETVSKIKEFLRALHYAGMFEMELYKVAGKIYFDKILLRSARANCAFYGSGINLPALLLASLMGEQLDKHADGPCEYGKLVVYESVLWDRYIRGEIGKREMQRDLDRADIKLIHNDDDLEPEKIFLHKEKRIFLRRSLGNIKRGLKSFIKKKIFPLLRPIKYAFLRYPQMKKANQRNPQSEKPRVIVTGRNYGSNLCMARSLGQAGYEVEVLRIFHRKPRKRNLLKMIKPDAYSKYVKAYHVCVYGGKSKRIVDKLISIADPARKMLIVPVDDLMASIVDDYYTELSEYYVCSNVAGRAGEINRMMGKAVQKELAQKAGLPVVNSCVIKTVKGEFAIPDTVTYPCFIKPNISKNGSKTKMCRCDSRQELYDEISALAEKKDVEMLVEDYLDIKREYSILGISAKKTCIGPGFFGAEEGGQEEHRGVAITGRVLDPWPEMQILAEEIIRFIASLDFEGLYDVDLIETTDGKLYFVELNMRFGGSGYAITASGLNLPGMYADYMLSGKPLDLKCRVESVGKSFVSEKVLIEEYIKSRLSWGKYVQIMQTVDIHFIKDQDDTKPYRHFCRFYIIDKMMRAVYKIKEMKDSEFGK